MRSRWLLSMMVMLCATLQGCGSESPVSAREVREIEAARARWLRSSVRNAYTYEVRQSCFCPVEVVRWNTVTVVNGTVTAVKETATGVIPDRATWAGYVTVDQLFERLPLTNQQYLAEFRVQFDPQYGYPVLIETVATPEIADGDVSTYARNLRPASGNP